MHYSEKTFRPPYEASTVLLQVTVGCSHNKCRFCNSYKDLKFKMEPIWQIEEDLQEVKRALPRTDRIFLLNADAFVMSYDKLKELAEMIHKYLPKVETISSMARVTNMKGKSVEQLKELRAMGYNDLYIGVESGLDEVLESTEKGVKTSDTIEQLKKLEAAGIDYACFYMIGLAGSGKCEENALATAKLFNQLKPKFISIPSLTLFPDTLMYQDQQEGKFAEASELERTKEMQTFIKNLTSKTEVLAHHVTINNPVVGHIPQDRNRMVAEIQKVIDNFDETRQRVRRSSLRSL